MGAIRFAIRRPYTLINERSSFGVKHSPRKAQNAFNQTPKKTEPTGHHRYGDLRSSDGIIPKVKTVGAESTEKQPE